MTTKSNQNPEQIAQDKIDEMLRKAGWLVQSKKKIDLSASKGIALRKTNTVSTEIIETLSVNEFSENVFSIYPNPTKNILYINGKENINKLSIHDLNDRLLKEINLLNSQTASEIMMDDFSIELYFLSIETEKGIYTHKVIKK